MISIKEAKKKAERVIGQVVYVDKDEESYIFAIKGMDENADIGGRVWVMNETGKVACNPMEYLGFKREQRVAKGLPPYEDDDE